jgi:hypothetical protein
LFSGIGRRAMFAAIRREWAISRCSRQRYDVVVPSACCDRRIEMLNMGIWAALKALFGSDSSGPADARKLDGSSESALGRSLRESFPDERHWITFTEARSLFSTKDDRYAFGEMDEEGKRKIESFAADHSSCIEFMPMEQRVYFVRNAQ